MPNERQFEYDIDIQHRFRFHPADTPEKQEQHEWVRHQLHVVAQQVGAAVPEGREKSLALTKLEEAMFWANAAIARNVPIEA